MSLDPSAIWPLAGQSLRQPRVAAMRLLDIDLPRQALWPLFWLVVAASVVASGVSDLMLPPPPEGVEPFTVPPIALAGFLAATLAAFSWGVALLGRGMGGQGTFEEALLLMVFLQFLILCSQAIQILLLMVAPGLAGLFVLAVALMALWINVNFIDALHDFGSLGKSFLVFFVVSVGIALVLMFLLTLTGTTVEGQI